MTMASHRHIPDEVDFTSPLPARELCLEEGLVDFKENLYIVWYYLYKAFG
jgi:hypothetical protein